MNSLKLHLFALVFCSFFFFASLLYLQGTTTIDADSSERLVRQGVLLIRRGAETSPYSYCYPISVAKTMKISCSEFIADQGDLTREVLYDKGMGKFSLIFITSQALSQDLDATETSILESYEQEFDVAEGLLGPVPSTVMSRYGVSSMDPIVRFNKMRWANGLTNSMDTGMLVITLGANTTVYAYGGNETQVNPIVWSYTYKNRIRVASGMGGLSPYKGADFDYCAVFWLTARLSPANKILKYYYSIEIADIMYKHSDGGMDGAPPVTDLYLDGSDIEYMMNNFVSPLGINPTLAIEYVDAGRLDMRRAYPALYDALKLYEDDFDFTGHWHGMWRAGADYQMVLNVIREERSAIQEWGFKPTLYYMVPGDGNYTRVTATAITDSPTWYVGQMFWYPYNAVPYISKSGDFDIWSPSLFRVPLLVQPDLRWGLRSLSQVLKRSGAATQDDYNHYQIKDMFNKPIYLGGYRIEDTHFQNWIYGRKDSDAPALTLIKNVITMGVFPIVPTRTWALAENLYFIYNYEFDVIYNANENTLTYNIHKVNSNARDRITLVLEGKNRLVEDTPLILKYDMKTTILTLNYKPSIIIKLDEEEKNTPHIINYQSSLLTSSNWYKDIQRMSFVLNASPGAISYTEVFCGDLGKPLKIWAHDCPADLNKDGVVNIVDIVIVAKAYYSCAGHPMWDPIADLNHDGIVNILDIVVVAKDYGKVAFGIPFGYDENRKILTVSVTHSDGVEMIVSWHA